MALWGSGEAAPQGGDLLPTRPLRKNPSCPRILREIRAVRAFFPELGGVPLRVGITRSAAGYASCEDNTIWLNPYRLRRHTIAHELVHLLQNGGHVPRGEKSADLYALARHLCLVDEPPYYLRIPESLRRSWSEESVRSARLLHELARESLARRASGSVRYIQWFEQQLRIRWDWLRHDRAGSPAGSQQDLGLALNLVAAAPSR